jgi:CTP:molybdopterin cytidylyltransferase MocA
VIAAITAGGRVSGALAAALGTDVKALAQLGNARLIDASIAAARAAGARRIAVVGSDAVRVHCGARVDDVIAESPSGRENLRRALATGERESLLLLTSDLPFVSGEAVARFVARTAGAEIALPLATAADYESAYPNAPPHATTLGNERVVNGSVVFFAAGLAPRVVASAQSFFSARKSPTRMALLLGPALVARFALGRLRIEHVEARARERLGIDARAVRGCAPSLCFDIDTLEDFRYALAHRERG